MSELKAVIPIKILGKWHKVSAVKHPISLVRVVFTRSVIVSIPEHKPAEEKTAQLSDAKTITGPTNKIDVVQVTGMPGLYQASMRTLLNQDGDPIDPYIVDMECVGIFKVDGSLDAAEAIRAVTITAHSVLYGAIREAVSWITGRHAFGPLVLGLSILQPTPPKASTSKD